MTQQELAEALGGRTCGPWINIPGPGHTKHDRSLGFIFDPKAAYGIRISSLAGNDPETCRAYICSLLKKLPHYDPFIIPDAVDFADKDDKRIIQALTLWDEGASADGTIVETYLASRKCLLLPISSALRFHPKCPWGGTRRVPAMIALMRDIVTGEPTGIHRTALEDDGSAKRSLPPDTPTKMMMGRCKRAAVMLSPSSHYLGIAEGIETALSAQRRFGTPVWACLSAGGIAGFPAINGLNHLTIFADHDAVGIKAAKTCAARYKDRSMNGEIKYPPVLGTDWNTEGGA
jgi:putative DNA primase/helicase